VGGIERRAAVRPGTDEYGIREFLALSVAFDHDVTDGAPVARFARRLQEPMGEAHGL
jgi:pyruvate/2-oxoglutarate dehydrogenase complex dihydrolipoamide acyltransferase (E2) component